MIVLSWCLFGWLWVFACVRVSAWWVRVSWMLAALEDPRLPECCSSPVPLSLCPPCFVIKPFDATSCGSLLGLKAYLTTEENKRSHTFYHSCGRQNNYQLNFVTNSSVHLWNQLANDDVTALGLTGFKKRRRLNPSSGLSTCGNEAHCRYSCFM